MDERAPLILYEQVIARSEHCVFKVSTSDDVGDVVY